VSERDYISFRHEYLVGSVDGNWRRELLRELWRDPDHVVKVEEKSGRLALRAQEWGVSEVEAARRIREEVTETNERLAPHRRGNKPQAGPSPIQEERYKAVVAARAELPDQVSGRQVRLHAARWAAANRPRLLPDDYVADGQLRCHCEESAIEMMARAENACKSPQRDLAAKPRP
jgi:hypothetical protein